LLIHQSKKKQIQAETSSVGKHKQKETRKPISQPILEELEKFEDKQPQILSEISEGESDLAEETLLKMSEAERQEYERREKQEHERELERRRNQERERKAKADNDERESHRGEVRTSLNDQDILLLHINPSNHNLKTIHLSHPYLLYIFLILSLSTLYHFIYHLHFLRRLIVFIKNLATKGSNKVKLCFKSKKRSNKVKLCS
jgi:hypothetical protein